MKIDSIISLVAIAAILLYWLVFKADIKSFFIKKTIPEGKITVRKFSVNESLLIGLPLEDGRVMNFISSNISALKPVDSGHCKLYTPAGVFKVAASEASILDALSEHADVSGN